MLGTHDSPYSCCWNDLPDELSIQVFQHLDLADLASVAATCRSWNILASDDLIWKKFGLEIWPYLPKNTHSSWKQYCFTYLTSDNTRDFFVFHNTFYTAIGKKIKYWKPIEPISSSNYESREILTDHHSKITTLYLSFFPSREPPLQFLTGSLDCTIKVWVSDLSDIKCISTLKGHNGTITSLKHKDNTIFSGSQDQTIKIWEPVDPKSKDPEYLCTDTLMGHEGTITCLQTKGEILLSGSTDKTIKVWKQNSAKYICVQCIKEHAGTITSLVYDPHEAQVISSSTDHTIKIWKSGKKLQLECAQILSTDEQIVTCLLKPPFRGILFTGNENGSVNVFEKKCGDNPWEEIPKTVTQENSMITNLRFCFNLTGLSQDKVYCISWQNMIKYLENKAGTKDFQCKESFNP